MKTRIYLPGRPPEDHASIRREVKKLLGAHKRRIESVEIRALDGAPPDRPGARPCEVTVRFVRGGYLGLVEQEEHLGRALLRTAWRVEQRRELGAQRLALFPSGHPAR